MSRLGIAKLRLKKLGRVSLSGMRKAHSGAKWLHREMTSPEAKRSYARIKRDLIRLSENYERNYDSFLLGRKKRKR